MKVLILRRKDRTSFLVSEKRGRVSKIVSENIRSGALHFTR